MSSHKPSRIYVWYPALKTLAKKTAWKFAETNVLDVVLVNLLGTVLSLMIPSRIIAYLKVAGQKMRRHDGGFGLRGGYEAAVEVSPVTDLVRRVSWWRLAARCWKRLESCDASWTVAVSSYRLWP